MDAVRSKLTELKNKRHECYRKIGRAQNDAKSAKNALFALMHEHTQINATWEYWRLSNKIEVLEEILK